MSPTLRVSDVWFAQIPYNDTVQGGKLRPVVIVGLSMQGAGHDPVAVIVPITSYSGVPKALCGDVEIKEWAQCGLIKPSWARSRRIWGMNPRLLEKRGPIGQLTPPTMNLIFGEIGTLF